MTSELRSIRQRYGSFDGRFPSAITVTVQRSEQWDIFSQRKKLTARDIKEFESDKAQLFGIVSLATALDHERRHFHDFMLSPVGSAILTARLSIVMNSIQAISNLTDSTQEFNTIPLPLPKWIEMSVDEQDSYLASISQFLARSGTSFKLTGPRLTADDPVYKALVAAGRATKLIQESLTYRIQVTDDFSAGLVDVAEASAILVQAQAIWTEFGESAYKTFLDSLTTGPENTYNQIVRILFNLKMPIEVVCAATTWALLGANDEAPPAFRFAAALRDLLNNGWLRNADSMGLFARWDSLFDATIGATAIADVMRLSLESDAKICAGRWELAKASGAPIATELAKYYEAYSTARRKLVKQFLADPTQFTDPLNYINITANLPEPLLVLVGQFSGTPEEVTASGATVISSEYRDGKQRVNIAAAPFQGPARLVHDVKTAQAMLLNFFIADALVTEVTNSDDLDAIQLLKRTLKDKFQILRLPL